MNQYIQNLFQLFMRNNISIPREMMNNPDAITQYLMNNNIITQDQYNRAVQKARMLGFRS